MSSFPSFYQSSFALAGGAVFTVLLLVASASDIRFRRIPNNVVLVTALCGIVFSGLGGGARGVLSSVLGALLGFVMWMPFYVVRWIGAGDVKLFGAVGAWLWPFRTFEAALLAAFVGGLLSLVWMLRARGLYGTGFDLSVAFAAPRRGVRLSSADARRVLPYGVALVAGALGIGWLPLGM